MGETRGTKTPEVGGRSVLVLTHLRVTLMTVQTHPPGWPCRDHQVLTLEHLQVLTRNRRGVVLVRWCRESKGRS